MKFIKPWDKDDPLELHYEVNPPTKTRAVFTETHITSPEIGGVILSVYREKYVATNDLPVFDLLECNGDTFNPESYPELYAYLGKAILPNFASPHYQLKYFILADLHE